MTRRRICHLPACCLLALGPAACIEGTTESTFIEMRDENTCTGSYPVCYGHTAGCVLDEDHYIKGNFPSGTRKILVETPKGDWKIRILLFLDDRLSPGTELEVVWYEPGCTDFYIFKLSKSSKVGDLFEQAGAKQVFETDQAVTRAGDHLVTFWSDAVCSYVLRVELVH